MDIGEAVKQVEAYEQIARKYFPYNTYVGHEVHNVMVNAGIEALVILGGDEGLFKGCLEEAVGKTPKMGCAITSLSEAIILGNRLRALSYLVKK